jgi:hypothetical protein
MVETLALIRGKFVDVCQLLSKADDMMADMISNLAEMLHDRTGL